MAVLTGELEMLQNAATAMGVGTAMDLKGAQGAWVEVAGTFVATVPELLGDPVEAVL